MNNGAERPEIPAENQGASGSDKIAPFLVFGQPGLQDDEIDEVVQCMRERWLGTGPRVRQFEQEFREYRRAEHAVAVNSCTAALHLSMVAAGVGAGDEVITTAMTFCATVNAIIHAGATPVLADVDRATMNIDPAAIEAKITPRTRALVIVHFAGRPCDMTAIQSIVRRHNLVLIEDCAHAIESTFQERAAGTFGDFGCFSFYATKNMTTGEGGMILTDRQDHADHLRTLALHGLSQDAWRRYSDAGFKHYHVVDCGFKYNMMDLQAAIGIHQLRRLEHSWHRRQQIWNHYLQELSGLPLDLPVDTPSNVRHAYHLFTVQVDEAETGISRDRFLEAMTSQNIGVGVHYLALPEHPYYSGRFGWQLEDYPHAARIGRQTVSLPLMAHLTDDDVERVIRAVRTVLRHASPKRGTSHLLPDEQSVVANTALR